MTTVTTPAADTVPASKWRRWEPVTGIAFVVLFVGSVVASSVPKTTASNKVWEAAWATAKLRRTHLTTGVLLVLAGLCLMAFLTTLWTRVATARGTQRTSPLPLVAAAASATSIMAGGVIMAINSAGSSPEPSAELLRLGNNLGFALVAIAGMLAAALSITGLNLQAHSCGIFGKKLFAFSIVVAVLLLASVVFIPIVGLLIWLIVVAITLLRTQIVTAS